MAPDPLAERIGKRIAAAREHAERLRKLVPELAARLRAEGATRVILFGSLASGSVVHEGTDVDLCVEGLAQVDAERLGLEFSERAVRVDIVRWETAPPELRAVIAAYGVPVDAGVDIH